jgi:hypothetical protein
MMPRRVDETGNKYGKLTVLRLGEYKPTGAAFWICRCDCGREVNIPGYSLRRGDYKSCGCNQGVKDNGHGGQFVDETGNRYGKLVVVRQSERKRNGLVAWICKCDCGETKSVIGSDLRTKGGIRSCGCIVGSHGHETVFDTLVARYKRQAAQRGYEWSISDEEAKEMTKKKCFYCGCEPYQRSGAKRRGEPIIYNGIDRVDNSKGYVPGNCVPCCGMCNQMKMAFSIDDFKSRIVSIYHTWAHP